MWYQSIMDVNDVSLAIEKLIEQEVNRAIEDIESEYEDKLEKLRDELEEARQHISELQSTLNEREAELERVIMKESC